MINEAISLRNCGETMIPDVELTRGSQNQCLRISGYFIETRNFYFCQNRSLIKTKREHSHWRLRTPIEANEDSNLGNGHIEEEDFGDCFLS